MDNKNNFYKYEDHSDISPDRYYGGKKTTPFIVVLLCVVGILVISAGSAYAGVLIAGKIADSKTSSKVVIYEIPSSPDVPLNDGEKLTIAGVAAKVRSSVVCVATETPSGNSANGNGSLSCVGTGVVWSKDGYIVTNCHIIKDAIKIKLIFVGGEKVDATVYSQDKVSDIAVLKINATGLNPIVLGNSQALVAGQEVVAMCNTPEASDGVAVANGIISAVCINTNVNDRRIQLLQTNATVNRGNSGGGLFDMNGNLVGIINAQSINIADGVGYAIPTQTAKTVVQDLFEVGFVRGRVDTDIVTLEEINNPGSFLPETGLRVASVNTKNSPFKVNDYLITMDDEQLPTISNWKARLYHHKIGETVTITVKRGDETLTIKYTIEEKVKP